MAVPSEVGVVAGGGFRARSAPSSLAVLRGGGALDAGWVDTARNRRSRRLLLTTNTEDSAIAAPASHGQHLWVG